jgi:hypothetical protein
MILFSYLECNSAFPTYEAKEHSEAVNRGVTRTDFYL